MQWKKLENIIYERVYIMKCEEVKEYIWLEDEISEAQLDSMKLHIQKCEECRKEYSIKKAFESDVNSTDYRVNIDDMIFSRRVLPKAIKKNIVSIAASFTIIFTVGFIALSEPVFGYNFGARISNIISSFRNSFGREFVAGKELVGSGETFVIEGIKLDIKSIAYSKSDLSIFFTLEDTKNINNGCQFGNILITVDNEPCSYQGNYGQNYTENISFGDFNISLKDDKVPNEVQLKIYDIYVEENAFNKLLADNGEQASKGKTRVIEGEWIIPIKLDEALIENANKHFAKYKLDYVFNCNDFSVKFTELTVEASKSEIFHELKINNESSKEVVGFSNVEIYSKEGKSISKMTYKNGRYIYKDQNNEIKEVTYRHSFPSSTIMLPFENVNPGKIKILSYTTYEKLGSIDLDLKNLKGKLEQHTDLGDLSVKVDKVSKHRYLLDISFKSRKITPIDMKLISEEQVLDYKDYSIGGREYSEGNIEGNFASVNQSYEINSLSNKYKLEIWGYRDNKIDIEIPIN